MEGNKLACGPDGGVLLQAMLRLAMGCVWPMGQGLDTPVLDTCIMHQVTTV